MPLMPYDVSMVDLTQPGYGRGRVPASKRLHFLFQKCCCFSMPETYPLAKQP